ncbi:MAG: ATP-binding cassette domain-containing protein [Epsilonproteobacteria bacterium]|nr:ATP-binding cassette domain-containing protein [Campylobacterota bacterium]
MLEIVNLSKTLGKHAILHDVTFSIQQARMIAFLGPNGAGKTTLFKTIIGLHQTPPADLNNKKNVVMFDGQVINSWPVHQRVAHGLLYLPQNTSLFLQMSVTDNLKLVFLYHPFWQNKTEEEFNQHVATLLAETNLTPVQNKKAHMLSGGQKRKLEVVRSLLMNPKLLLLDEPFAGVDPKSIYELKKIFAQMVARGITVVISDHHVEQLLSIAQTVFVMLDGKIVTSGTLQEILQNRYTKETYLGSQFYEEMSDRFLTK